MNFEDLKFDMSQASMQAGRMVYRSYTIKRQIQLGFGLETWQARDDNKKRTVVLVFLPGEIVQNTGLLDEIDLEVQVCAKLDHPNLVHVHTLRRDKKSAAIDMQFVEGKPIAQQYTEDPQACLEVKTITTWIAQLCHALSYAHRRMKTPHGSIRPGHLIVTPGGLLRLSGLGFSKLSGFVDPRSMPADGASPLYPHQSPQQAIGQEATISDDIYAIGATLYELLTSKPPFYDGDVSDKLANEVPPSMAARRKELGIKGKAIPPKWEAAVAACLSKKPKDRPASVAELAEMLGLPSTDSATPPVAAPEKKPIITKLRVAVVSIILLTLSLLAAGGWWLGGIVNAELKRQAEAKRIRAEERAREDAARMAALQAEQERQNMEAVAAAKAAEAERAAEEALKARQKEEERLAMARGGLSIDTNPSRATITLASGDSLKSPAKFELLPLGSHTLTIEKPGYVTIQREVVVKEEQITEVGTLELTRATGKVSIQSQPAGATVFHRGEVVGKTPLVIEEQPTGPLSYILQLEGYLSANADGRLTSDEPLKWNLKLQKRSQPVAGKPWENDLRMKFQPIEGLKVLFGVYETRVREFEQFVAETGYQVEGGMRSLKDSKWGQYGHTWKKPGFEQGGDHPVVGVSWKDAKAFCSWLTKRDRATGVLSGDQFYRLPTDAEWSTAVRLRESDTGTPDEKNGENTVQYPWGTQWPLPEDVGNYAGYEASKTNWPDNWDVLNEYRDEHARTAPVGSFLLRLFGLRDMGGNVMEWCEDPYKPGDPWRVLRGGSWSTNRKDHLLSSHREYYGPDDRYSFIGFRCVVAY